MHVKTTVHSLGQKSICLRVAIAAVSLLPLYLFSYQYQLAHSRSGSRATSAR